MPSTESGLSPQDKEILTKTWSVVAHDLQGNGEALFHNIFKAAPGAIELFSFKNEAKDLRRSVAFKTHALMVMRTVDVAIYNIDDLSPVVPVLQKLGKRHSKYKVVPEHFPIVGGALLQTIKDCLKEKWTKDVEVFAIHLHSQSYHN